MNVVQVIERLRRDDDVGRSWGAEHRDPRPLEPATLASLRVHNGGPVSEELTTWLAYDATWFPLLDAGAAPPRLALAPLREILRGWAESSAQGVATDEPPPSGPADWTAEDTLNAFIDFLPDSALADAPALELPPSGSQEHLLIHRRGRVAVLGCSKRFEFWWKYDSFAAFLAHYFGYEEPK